MNPLRILSVILPAAAILTGCGKGDSDLARDTDGKPVVFASVAPVAGLTRKIAGDRIEVRSLVGPGEDPHDFSPSPKQLVNLGNADAFFIVGMPFEETLVEKLSNGAKNLRIVDLADGIEKLEMDDDHHHHHHEDEDGKNGPEAEDGEEKHDHDHEGEQSDPHLWLSPPLLRKQAHFIAEFLEELDPKNAEFYHQRAESLEADLDALHHELAEQLAPLRGNAFYVYHGAFAYFADAYDLEQKAIEIGGRSPEIKRINELVESAKADGVKMIFVQPQFDSTSAETIAEAIGGGAVVPIDPLEEDVIANLRRIAQAIKEQTE